ncbi:hypothetical protein DSCA_23280 [Desulfosarcina alkanivorans]|uniref:Uncharacterized protein n=1 Tax=Desulfosarcina alkanivorans TaxID=571177 RepID=A0A5K7YH80_9BACT|nr:hypothetical protein DSCA_23280 [Desulfosarcina alkanivorans]
MAVDRKTGKHIVDPNKPEEISIKKALAKGGHSIRLCFVNDRLIPGVGDRNLFVESVKIKNIQYGIDREIWNYEGIADQFLVANNYQIERQIQRIQTVYPHQTVAITEANTRFGDGRKIDIEMHKKNMTLKSALWYAGLLNTSIRKGVPILCHFSLIGKRLGFGMIRPDDSVTPHYKIMKLYSDHSGSRKVRLNIQSKTYRVPLFETSFLAKGVDEIKFLDAVSSYCLANKEIVITVLNRHPDQSVETLISFPDRVVIEPTVEVIELLSQTSINGGPSLGSGKQGEEVVERQFTLENGLEKLVLKPASLAHIFCKILNPQSLN